MVLLGEIARRGMSAFWSKPDIYDAVADVA
jgi:hypothetical protein